ncbi:MAG TPA: sigma-70 family RNA polymerase sigma factor [Verrucomicrobiota bacterium]|nr:hypothetical protein [Verrucomicrobiales bacterium]HRI11899.1 sigma-70 family RNA polymerase sigma factor [Verrucomicrobiota bacterium]
MVTAGLMAAGPLESGDVRGEVSFKTTQWNLIRAAGGLDPTESRKALEMLCRAYWFPVYGHIRRSGFGPEQARDLTQGFFAELLERNRIGRADPDRGRFRSFLLASVNHFLGHERDHHNARKRGAGQTLLSLQDEDWEGRYAVLASSEAGPDVQFDCRWAHVILDRVLAVLRREFDVAGQIRRFDTLKTFLVGDRGDLPIARAAERLGMSEGAVKSAIHRLRTRFRELFRDEVAQTISGSADLEDEMRHLIRSLRGAGEWDVGIGGPSASVAPP